MIIILLKLKVIPNSKEFRIRLEMDEKNDYLKIWLKSPTEKGKANKELIKALKSIFGEFSFVSVVRRKYIKIDYDIKEVTKKFNKIIKNLEGKTYKSQIIFIAHRKGL